MWFFRDFLPQFADFPDLSIERFVEIRDLFPSFLEFRESFFPSTKSRLLLKEQLSIPLATQPCISVTTDFYDVPFCSTRERGNLFIYFY